MSIGFRGPHFLLGFSYNPYLEYRNKKSITITKIVNLRAGEKIKAQAVVVNGATGRTIPGTVRMTIRQI